MGMSHHLPILQFPNILPPDLLALAQLTAYDRRGLFKESEVIPPRPDYRESMVLKPEDFGLLYSQILTYMQPHLETMLRHYGFVLPNYAVEYQLTAHGNGNYFRMHTDTGHGVVNNRRLLAFVIYFSLARVNRFTGGELVLYPGMWYKLSRGVFNRIYNPRPHVIQPIHNSVVFFDPRINHEVRDVVCGQEWHDQRFTINGWVLRPA